jgi:hypothetical protein
MKKLSLALTLIATFALSLHAAVTSVTWNSVNGGTNAARNFTVNAGSPITDITATVAGTLTASPGGCGITPTLPAGLTWTQTSTTVCTIAGTATAPAPTKSYLINFRSSGAPTDSLSFITLTVGPITNLSYGKRYARFTKNIAITTLTPTIFGSPTAYSITGPGVTDAASFNALTGLTFNTSTGAISGTPTANLSSTKFIINATDGVFNVSGGTAGLVDSLSLAIVDAANYSSWTYFRTITVTPTGLGGDVSNYPLLVKLDSNNFTFSQSSSDITTLTGSYINGTGGADIRFTLADGVTDLAYQVERWDAVAKLAEIWVNVPKVAGGSSTGIKMYWGKAGQTTTSSGSATFPTEDNNQAVYHMNSNGAGDELDATANGFLATVGGTAPTANTSSLIGLGRTFGGAGYFKLSAPSTVNGVLNFAQAGQYTISSWVNANTTPTTARVIVHKGDRQFSLNISGNNPNGLTGQQFEGTEYTVVPNATGAATLSGFWAHTYSPIITSAWSNVVLVQNNGARSLYVNGTLSGYIASQPSSFLVDRQGTGARQLDRDVTIGGMPGTAPSGGTFSRYFTGPMDEISVHNTARDSNWVKLNFQTQCMAGVPASCPSSPVAYGSIQLSGPPVGLSYTPNPATYKQGIAITTSLPNFVSGGGSSYTITPNLTTNTGLAFNTLTGAISGTPTLLSAPTNYEIIATNPNGSDTESVSITVTLPTTPNLSYTGSPYALTATRSAGTITPSNSGDVATACAANPTLPTGLSLSTTCVITGTPTASAASTAYSIISSNLGGVDTAAITIAVADTLPTITSQPTAKNAVTGASNVTFTVGATRGGAATVTYKWVRTKSGASGGAVDTIRVVSGTSATADTLALAADSVNAANDSSSYKVVVSNGAGSAVSNAVLLRIVPSVTFSPSTVVVGKVATTVTPTTTGTITSCAITPGLPAGLTISATTCVISGTPTAGQTPTNYSITPTGPGGAGTAFVLNLMVQNLPTSLIYTPDSAASFEQNTPISKLTPFLGDTATAPATYAVTSGTLPAGLSIDANTGSISGTPTSVSSGTVTIQATNASGSIARSLTLSVYAAESYTGRLTNFTLNTTNSGAGVASAQANFPVLIRLTNAHRAIFQATDSAGIRFTNAAGTHLPYQIENWKTSATDTSAAIWVKADTVAANGTTTVRMYYGQALGGGRSNGPAVFPRSSGYHAVFHMANGSGDEMDASNSGYVAVANGAPLDSSGAIGRSRNFNGTNQYFAVANSAAGALNYRMTDSYTFSSWVFVNDVPATGSSGIQILNKGDNQYTMAAYDGNATPKYWEITTRGNNTYLQARSNGTPSITANSHIGSWRFISGTYTGAPVGQAIAETLYIDGVRVNTLAATNTSTQGRDLTYNVHIGALAAGTAPGATFSRYFVGQIDELRMSYVTRSPDFIKLNYKNQKPGASPVANLAYSSMSPTYMENTPITANVASVMGSATRYAAASLPAGLSLNPTTGEITGTPTAASASTPYAITAYGDSSWSTTSTLNITVTPSAPTGLSYVEDSLVLLVGQPITPDTGFVTGTTSIDSFTVAPGLPAGLSISKTTGIISGAPSAVSGMTQYIITAQNSAGSVKDTIYIVVNDLPPSFTYTSPQTYMVGTGITTLNPVSTGGFVLAYTITPNLTTNTGLAFNTSSGAISGTPTTLQAATVYTIIGTNGVGADTATVSITVNPAIPVIAYATPKTFIKGVVDSVNVASTGGTVVSYAVNPALPAGLALTTSTGKISGTPTAAAAAANYSVVATNVSGLDTAVINITVQDLTPIINYAALVDSFTTGTVAAKNAQSTGGTVTAWSISPTLPAGLVFSTSTGGISGTPTTASAAANYTVIGTNAYGADTVVLNLKVKQGVSILPGAYTFRVSGAEKPYTFILPAGISGTEQVTMRITDMYGRTIWSRAVRPDASSTVASEVTWNGKTATGLTASAGMYIVRVSVLNGGKNIDYVQKTVSLKAR